MINQSLLLAGDDAYNLTKSLRLRSSASAYLNRTPAGAGNRKTWTLSFWMKLGSTNVSTYGDDIFFVNGGSGASTLLNFSYDKDSGVLYTDVTGTRLFQTNAVFRDFSAWYHVVLAFDSTQATSTNRIKLYINNVLQTFSTYNAPTLNADYAVNGAYPHYIGRDPTNAWFYLDAYLAEMNLVDGQQLTPSSFGSTNALTGVWQPAKYTGTYGTNGFYLPFTNTTSTTTLGYDFSGNSNNWTTNNISLTAGTTYDSMTDVPTMSALGSNYAVMNPVSRGSGDTTATFSDGNLTLTANSGSPPTQSEFYATMASPSTGKFYAECIFNQVFGTDPWVWPSFGIFGHLISGQAIVDWTTGSSYGRFSNNDVCMMAWDVDNGKIWWGKNGTWFNSGNPSAGTGHLATFTYSADTAIPFVGHYFSTTGSKSTSNFGQQPFSYTPPTGFVALNTFNLPEPSIKAGNKHFNAVTWTGTGTSSGRSITGVGFQPDLVWGKPRSLAYSHSLSDAVRGSNKRLSSGTTGAEDTNFTYGYTSSFDSDGFTTTAGASSNENWNTTGESFVAWNWKAGNSAGSSNTAGSITSTVSANPTAGFSVVTYTGNGSTGTIGHGLGVAPSMIIVKSRSTAQRWTVFHTSTSNAYIYLNETFAAETGNANLRFGNNSSVVQPTSAVFTIGNSVDVNQNTTTYVAYCFAEIAGYSKFGSYTGNGSTDGTFVHLGFRPKFLMVKCSSNSSTNWFILDTTRDTYNLSGQSLMPNLSNAEYTPASSGYFGDILSNGFKWRDASNNANNASGYTYIYMAFAENPFKYSLAR